MAAYRRFMTHITCRLTAKNRDQLRNSTLGNRVWATFTFSKNGISGTLNNRDASGSSTFFENLYSPKTHGRYRQDTDMYKRPKKEQ